MGWKEWYVIGVSLATVGLWCANTALQPYLGQMGITAIVPMVAFFGFGILNKARRRPRSALLLPPDRNSCACTTGYCSPWGMPLILTATWPCLT